MAKNDKQGEPIDPIYGYTLMGQYLSSLNYDKAKQEAVTTCEVCGGKYRPAGGPCIHESRSELWQQQVEAAASTFRVGIKTAAHAGESLYNTFCGLCGCQWYPGHTCIRQPTPEQVRELAKMSLFVRLMDKFMGQSAEELGCAVPADWEAM